MGFNNLIRFYSQVLIAIGVLMLVPFAIGVGIGEAAANYIFGAVICIAFGGVGAMTSLGAKRQSSFRGILLLVLVWWTITPIFAAAPLALDGRGFDVAYFDAVAALTTTGGWVSRLGALDNAANAIWLALLQWVGGLASISIAAAIFIRPVFIGIDTLLPPFSRGDRGDFLRPLRNAIAAFAAFYALLTFIAFVLLVFAGASSFEALIMATSTIASGGFLPYADGLESVNSTTLVVLGVLVVLSGANFALLARLFRGKNARLRDVETLAYTMIIIFVGIMFWAFSSSLDIKHFLHQLFHAASLLSTNGYMFEDAPPLPIVLVTAIIGGSAVSSAGGFKILRWLVIMRRAREEILRLIAPSRVFGGRRVAQELSVWIHFLVFTLILAVLLLILSTSGAPFELSASAVVASVANTGPIIYLAPGGEDGFGVFASEYRWVLAAAMVLGRLETAAALALLNRAFWRS